MVKEVKERSEFVLLIIPGCPLRANGNGIQLDAAAASLLTHIIIFLLGISID